MKTEIQPLSTQNIRKVLLTIKSKSTSVTYKINLKINDDSQSEDDIVESSWQEEVVWVGDEEKWGNHLSGNRWVEQQKKNNQFKIVDQSDFVNYSPNLYKFTFLEVGSVGSKQQKLELFEDQTFPRNQQSITGQWGFMKKYEAVHWQRASKKLPDYALFQDKVSPNSLVQGKLGDCYFLAAMAALAQRPDRIFKMFLTSQTSVDKRYAVKMLYKGKWKIIELDQFFVFQQDKIQFSRSTRQQLWIMFVEKAWAKLYRSYMNISAGHAEQCLHDFTGAPIKFFNLKSKNFDKTKFWKYLIKASKRQYAMCASSNAGSDTKMSETGIVQGHAYTLLKTVNLKFKGQKVKLLQLRNPWGRKQSRGNWSDTDPRWKKVSQEQKDKLQFDKNQEDGIFFIEFEDFARQYRGVVVAQINDNASYVYQSRKDPNCEGVLFKLQLSETARYSLQVDKTPKRTFRVKKTTKYKYPLAVLKVYDCQHSFKQIHSYSDTERLTSRKYTLKKGDYLVFVHIEFDPEFETEYDVTLAVYSQYCCSIRLASNSDRRKIGQIQLPSQKELKKKRFKSTPKPTMSELTEQIALFNKPNIKFSYVNTSNEKDPRPYVQIKNKLTLISKSINNKETTKQQNQNRGIDPKQISNLIPKIIESSKGQIVNGEALDLVAKIEKQIIFIEASPAQKRLADLIVGKKDFLDDRFQPTLASLSGQWGEIPEWKNVRWQRISKMMPNARIFSQNITPYSIRQGFLGDCYFLATLAALAEKPSRIFNLFLLTQKNQINYYSVKMLYRGKWLTIDMDDYIPYMYDMPAFSYAVNNQLWVILLQKAWAKMYSSYKRIEAGFPEEALHDLTAAPIRHVFLQKPSFKPEQEWAYLMRASDLQYSMVASSQVGSDSFKSVSGIVQGHAYTVLKVVQLKLNGQTRRLLQLRNPWGKVEGSEQWSDDSKIWDWIDSSQKMRIGYQRKEDGVFFIDYELFCRQFKLITIAQINDNASYVYLSCEDSKLQGCYFTVNILKEGRYSFQIDNTPQRFFENHYHTDYQYPNINFQLGIITEHGYVKRLVQLTSNSRALYHSNVFSPGIYICYAKIDFNAKFQKIFDINLAIYGDFACEIRLSDKREAVMMANNPNINWPPQKKSSITQKQGEWNSLRSYNKSSRRSNF